MTRRTITTCIALLIFHCHNSRAAEIYFDPPGNSIYIEGKIEPGDEERFRQVVLDVITTGQYVHNVFIYSPGGSLQAAISIGRQIRTLQLATQAPVRHSDINNNAVLCVRASTKESWARNWPQQAAGHLRNDDRCLCNSACFFIWAAGTYRGGDWIGLHRPYFEATEFAHLSPTQAQAVYEASLPRDLEYLKEMGIPDHLIEKMMAADSTQVDFMSEDEARLLADSPALTELEIARCNDPRGLYRRAAEAFKQGNPRLGYELFRQAEQRFPCIEDLQKQLFQENKGKYLAKYGPALPDH